MQVSNFEKLITVVKTFGANYTPSFEKMKVPQLEDCLAKGQTAMSNLIEAENDQMLNRSKRKNLMKEIPKTATSILKQLKYADVSESLLEDANSVVNGFKKKKNETSAATEKEVTEKTEATINKTQHQTKNLEQKIEIMEKLIDLVQDIPEYKTNEKGLSKEELKDYLTLIKTTRKQIDDSELAISNARITRNVVLYKPQVGLVEVAKAVKDYINDHFGSKSPERKQVTKILFRTVKI